MKYLLSWIEEFLPQPLPGFDETIKALEQLGFSVAGVERREIRFEGVVVAHVAEAAPHPNADRLRLTTVFDGSQKYQVVCGAPNVAQGQRIAFARLGARLPMEGGQPFLIEPRKIRGVESQGMICSGRELGFGGDHEGIMVLPDSWELGQPLQKYIRSDAVIDLELPSNRWDLMSHLGLARELAVYFWRASSRDHQLANPVETRQKLSISIAPDALTACARYEGVLLSGIQVGPSSWLVRERLLALGQPVINNVVDATNYVMLELGQPLHAFDWSKIKGKSISVRWARSTEKLTALNGQEYALGPEDLVIADAERPVALAGIIGGEETKVVETTTDVFLECAWFSRKHVRRRAKALGISTESSQRFEKETDIFTLGLAMNRVMGILKQSLAVTVQATTSVFPRPPAIARFELSPEAITKTLGFSVSNEELFSLLTPLSEETQKIDSQRWTVTPHSWRGDLRLNEDIAEEALRYLGFDKIRGREGYSARIPASTNIPSLLRWRDIETGEKLDDILQARAAGKEITSFFLGDGFFESINYSLVSRLQIENFCGASWVDQSVELENPVSSDMAFLRPLLSLGLYQNWRHNRRHGATAQLFFQETGYAHSWSKDQKGATQSDFCWAALASGPATAIHWKNSQEQSFDFWKILGAVEKALELQGMKTSRQNSSLALASWHPHFNIELFYKGEKIGFVAQLATDEVLDYRVEHPVVVAEINLSKATILRGLEKSVRVSSSLVVGLIRRDLSVVVEKDIPWGDIAQSVRSELGDLVDSLAPFDIYTSPKIGKTKKSIAFRLWLKPNEGTPRLEEINSWLDRASRVLESKHSAVVRHG